MTGGYAGKGREREVREPCPSHRRLRTARGLTGRAKRSVEWSEKMIEIGTHQRPRGGVAEENDDGWGE